MHKVKKEDLRFVDIGFPHCHKDVIVKGVKKAFVTNDQDNSPHKWTVRINGKKDQLFGKEEEVIDYLLIELNI